MRVSLVFVSLLALGAGASCSGCGEPAALCGNGAIDVDETEATCCKDTGCAFGACANDGACTDPWTTCGGAGVCSAPYLCAGDDVPAYDCATCGCTNNDACVDGVCLDSVVRGLERSGPDVASNLDVSDYVKLFTDLAVRIDDGEVLTVAQLAARIGADLHADRRNTALVIGADPSAAIDGVLAEILGAIDVPPTVNTSDACIEVATAAAAGLLPETFVLAVVDDDDASAITCPYAGTWARCELPQATDCVERFGRLAHAIVVVDMAVTLAIADEALLVRAGIGLPETVDPLIGEGLDALGTARTLVPPQEGFRVGDRFAMAFDLPGGAFVVIGDPNAKSYRLASFREVWNDTLSQQFMIEHDIQTRDCAFEIGAGEVVDITCENAGAVLHAVVDGSTFTLLDVDRSPS